VLDKYFYISSLLTWTSIRMQITILAIYGKWLSGM
jgi:hypothetical protein